MTRATVDLSVMICTWNNAGRLRATLDALARCDLPTGLRWELVVVNNNSSDETDLVVQSFCERLPIVHVYEPRQGLSHARNAGVTAATGHLLVFTDDDVRPVRGWIAAYWDAYRARPGGFYFGGPVQSQFGGAAPDPELLSLAPPSVRGLELAQTAPIPRGAVCFVGANWACAAADLARAGSFDTQLGLDPSTGRVRTGEESDLMRRLETIGLRPWYVPEARIVHLVPPGKCTLAHVGDRARAHSRYRVVAGIAAPQISGRRVPRWMYRTAATLWLRWVLARAGRRNGYVQYVEWRRMLGQIEGTRELIRARATATSPHASAPTVGRAGASKGTRP